MGGNSCVGFDMARLKKKSSHDLNFVLFFFKVISLNLYSIFMKIVKVLIPVHFLDTKIENSLTVLNK